MKVVLLAAGRSVRMAPVSDKNFLEFCGKTLIERQIESLKSAGFKEILVVAGKHNFAELKGIAARGRATVREQKNLDDGMAGAVLTAANWIGKNSFLLVSGNDITDDSAYAALKKHIARRKNSGALLAYEIKEYFPGGYLKIGANGIIKEIIEKPQRGREPSKFVNIVMHYHSQPQALFDALKQEKGPAEGRYERAVMSLFARRAGRNNLYRAVPFTGFWQPVKYPRHALKVMDYFLSGLKPGRGTGVEVAKSAIIKSNVYLDDGVKILDNAVIAGPCYIGKNTIIGTNALVRSSNIGKNCVIGFASEIARSHIGGNVWTHANYIGDSIIGSNVSFGSGTVTGNLRLDENNIGDSGVTKLGLITGNHIRVGINTSFMPGVKIGSNSMIGAGIVVGADIPEKSYVMGKWELKIKPNREKIIPRK